MTQATTSPASSPTFEYLEHDMSMTRDFYQMYMTADSVSNFVYGLLLAPLSLIAITEAIIKNGLFLMYNIIAFTLNTIIDVVTKVSEFVMSFFDDGSGSSSSPFSSLTSYFGGTTQPVHTIPTEFDSHDLISLKFALREGHIASRNALEVGLDHLLYYIWYDSATNAVNIQENPRELNPILEIKITDRGQITSIRLGGVEEDHFPDAFQICMLPCFDKAHEISSSYLLDGNEIQIRTLKRSVQRIPAYHLDQFIQQLVQVGGRVPRLDVQFLESNLQRDAGIDAGGPTRDLVSIIAAGATSTSRNETRNGVTKAYGRDLSFEIEIDYALKMPFARGPEAHPQIPGICKLTTPFERDQYEQIGALMAFVYASHSGLTIGSIFEKAVYKAALSLTTQEANTDFNQLTERTLLKMVRNIIQAKEMNSIVIERLDLLENQNLNQVQWARVLELLQFLGEDVENFNYTNLDHQLDLKNKLKAGFWERYGHYLAPIHAIAGGIRNVAARWRVDLQNVTHEQFCDKVQGLYDRETIANSFEISNSAERTPAFEQQLGWLREWVRDPVIPRAKVYDLLHFATGSRSLQPGSKINITTQHARAANRYTPLPEAHTCFNRIDLCPHFLAFGNRTKEEFYETLNQGLGRVEEEGFSIG